MFRGISIRVTGRTVNLGTQRILKTLGIKNALITKDTFGEEYYKKGYTTIMKNVRLVRFVLLICGDEVEQT